MERDSNNNKTHNPSHLLDLQQNEWVLTTTGESHDCESIGRGELGVTQNTR